MNAPINALYFDGKSSRQYHVTLRVQQQEAVLEGDIERRCALSDLRVSERFRRANRKITFPDGAYLEIADTDALNALLHATQHQESVVVRAQHHWRAAIGALAAVIVVLVLAYFYLLPIASKIIADALPLSIDRRIGEETLTFLDNRLLQPSELPLDRQSELVVRFANLAPPNGQTVPDYKILFRKSAMGPNAFALPSGEIVVTDSLVTLLDDDDSMMGVLAHELGHLHERHMMRRLIQGSVIGGAATVLFGDVSIVAANLSTLVLDMHYSREAEREADDYAIAMFKANGIPLSKLANVFEKLGKHTDEPLPYIASHPLSSERIAHIRQSQ